MDSLLKALVEGVTPLNDRPHVLSFTLECQVAPQTLFSSNSHANVLQLFLDHFLGLRVEKVINLKLKVFLFL